MIIDKRNDWDKICVRLKEKGEDKLWDYLTALRSMDKKKEDCGGHYIKTMMTDPLRGVHYRVEDIRVTYKSLKDLRSSNDILRLIKHFVNDMEHTEWHYIEHTIAGWRAICEEEIADHLEDVESLCWNRWEWCFELICKINKFVRKICVKGGLIG